MHDLRKKIDRRLAETARAAEHLPAGDLRFRDMPPFGKKGEHIDICTGSGPYTFILAPASGPITAVGDPVTLVAVNGGCVRLDPALGEGAAFRVLLPLRVPSG